MCPCTLAHLAGCLLEGVLGLRVIQLDGLDAAQIVYVSRQLLLLPRRLRPLSLRPQRLRLRPASVDFIDVALTVARLSFMHKHASVAFTAGKTDARAVCALKRDKQTV